MGPHENFQEPLGGKHLVQSEQLLFAELATKVNPVDEKMGGQNSRFIEEN